MKTKAYKVVPNKIIVNEKGLKSKSLGLYIYLYCKVSYKTNDTCICTYTEILEVLDIPFDKNYKRKVREQLNKLLDVGYIYYEENSNGDLRIDTPIKEPDLKEGNYTRIPYSVINNKDIPVILIPTYLAILHFDYMKEKCNPSIPTIAKYAGCSINTCKARIKALEELNLLEIERSKGGGYGKAINTNTFYTSNGESFYYELLEVNNLRYEYQIETTITTENTEEIEYLDTRKIFEFKPKDNSQKWHKKELESSHLPSSYDNDLCHKF